MTREECIDYALACGNPRFIHAWFDHEEIYAARYAIRNVGSMIDFWKGTYEQKLMYILLAIEAYFGEQHNVTVA